MDLEHIWVKASQCREDLDADACVTENDVLLTPLSSGTTGLVLKREILLYTFFRLTKMRHAHASKFQCSNGDFKRVSFDT